MGDRKLRVNNLRQIVVHLREDRLQLVTEVWQNAVTCAISDLLELFVPLEFNCSSQDSANGAMLKPCSNIIFSSMQLFQLPLKMGTSFSISIDYIDVCLHIFNASLQRFLLKGC